MENNSQEAASVAALPSMDEYVKSRQATVAAEPNVAEEKPVVEAKQEEVADPEPLESEKEESGGGKSSYAKLRERIRDYKTKEETWQSERADLLNRLSGKTEKVETKPAAATSDDPEPDQASFSTYEAFVKAQSRWEARQEFKEQAAKARETQQKQSEIEEEQSTFKGHGQRIAEAKAKYPDFDEVAEALVKQGIDLAEREVALSVAELDNSGEVLYYLLKNPDVIEKLNGMKVRQAFAEIGRISASLVKPEAEASPKPKPSAAPTPIKPVNGNAGKSTVPLAQLSMDDYAKARKAGRAS